MKKKAFVKSVLFAVAALACVAMPEKTVEAASKKGDSLPLSGFSYIYQEYENAKAKKNSDEESTTLLSTPIEVPENAAIAKVEEYCNIRSAAGTNSSIVGIFTKNSMCEVIGTSNGWAHIKSGKVDGYIKTDYLYMGSEGKKKAEDVAELVVTLNADAVNIRKTPDTSTRSNIIMKVSKGEKLNVIESGVLSKNDSAAQVWVKVEIDSSDSSSSANYGYISKQYVDLTYSWKTATPVDEIEFDPNCKTTDIRRAIVTEAKKHIGLKYVWGGNSLTTGADCSGFVLACYRSAGLSTSKMDRTSAGMAAASLGKTVKAENIQPGDLVFYGDSSGHVDHVAMYIGDGMIIHESGHIVGCKISELNYRKVLKIKNYIDYIY